MWEITYSNYPYQVVGIALILIGIFDLFYTRHRSKQGWVQGSWSYLFRKITKDENPEEFELFLFAGVISSIVFIAVGVLFFVIPFFL